MAPGIEPQSALTDADVLLIGCGPAACAAALHVQRAGLRCLMVGPERATRHEAVESVPPGIESLLAELGLTQSALSDACCGRYAAIVTEGKTRSFPRGIHGQTQGWHLQRSRFDARLRTAAINAGCRWQRETVAAVRCGIDQVTLATPTRRLQAPWLIDGSGRNHVLQRALGLATQTRSAPLVLWRGIAQDVDAPSLPRFTQTEAGWLWEAGLADGRLSWVLYATDGQRPTRAPFATSDALHAPQGHDMTWRLTRPCASARYRIAGDAAAVVDARSGQGMLFALESGIAAADSIIQAHRAPRSAQAWLAAQYDAWVRAEFVRKTTDLTTAEARA